MTSYTPKNAKREIAVGLTFAAALLLLLWALAWANAGYCFDCGGPCAGPLDCPGQCECMFPENDDNHHFGRCV